MRKRPVARASRGVSPLAAMLLFFAFTAPLGIVAHLVSELAGLGWHDDADVVLSARHGYLALIALGALVALGLALRAVPRGDRRTRIAAIVDALPFKGQGARFVALSFAAQFGFFAITQIGEGCPLCGGDVVVGVVAAALAALCGALAIMLGKRRLIGFVLALAFVFAFEAAEPSETGGAATRRRGGLLASRRRTPFAFRYRPPPFSQHRLIA